MPGINPKYFAEEADPGDDVYIYTFEGDTGFNKQRKMSLADLKANYFQTLETKSYTFKSRSGSKGEHFIGGFYDYETTDANLTQVSTTVNLGTADVSYAAHVFCVAGGAGTTDGSDLVLTVTGTSMTDAGVRTTGDSQVIVSDGTSASLNEYFETPKKWIGQVTFTLSSTGGSNFDFDFNYGFCKYEDFGNSDFTVVAFEVVGLANANDDGFNVQLLHHKATGWTYAATGFVAGSSEIAGMNTDHVTEVEISSGEDFAYKRTGLSQVVTGSGSEGTIIRVTTDFNGAVGYLNAHLGIQK